MPIHRQLLLRKVSLWTRSNPVATPKFLDVVSDGLENQFDVPIEMEDAIDLRISSCRD
jgi:hypothetical protein